MSDDMPSETSMNDARTTLNAKHQRFVEEYLIDLNATSAYKRAGYKAKRRAAENAASRLLRTPWVQSAIRERLAASMQASVVTIERLELVLQRLAMVDPRRLYMHDGRMKLPHEWDDDTAAAVAGIEVHEEFDENQAVSGCVKKVKVWDKRAAIIDLLKRRDLAGKGEMGSPDNPMIVRVIEIVRPAPAPPVNQETSAP
jgi:phage terminase small subunit